MVSLTAGGDFAGGVTRSPFLYQFHLHLVWVRMNHLSPIHPATIRKPRLYLYINNPTKQRNITINMHGLHIRASANQLAWFPTIAIE